MKEIPGYPGVHAAILEWNSEADDTVNREYVYLRVKVFSAEGKKHADIEVPYEKSYTVVSGIQARTIKPDGSIVPFNGKVFDKTIVKSQKFKIYAKTFTLSDVQPGSVLEYRYTLGWEDNILRSSYWEPQSELYIAKAHFRLKPYNRHPWSMYWQSFRLPEGTTVKQGGQNTYTLDVARVPPFPDEAYRPPDSESKPRVVFWYTDTRLDIKSPDAFWANVAKEWSKDVEKFIGNPKSLVPLLQPVLAGGESEEEKLRKIYSRVQQLHNSSFASAKSEQELKREKIKADKNVDEVWKTQYGNRISINRTFVALARAAGMDANIVKVSQRDRVFFRKEIYNTAMLDEEIAHVLVGGKEYFLDPGTPMCPFGLLSWENTGTMAIKLNKEGGVFITTPGTTPAQASITRTATLKLAEGTLSGSIKLTMEGQEALRRRLTLVEEDEAAFSKELTNQLVAWLPEGSGVKLVSTKALRTPDEPLQVEFDVSIPGAVSQVGSRILVPAHIFEARTKDPFPGEQRIHPLYFRYPYMENDVVTIEVPPTLRAESLPKATSDRGIGRYESTWSFTTGKLVARRQFIIEGLLYLPDYYQLIRNYFGRVVSSDQQTAVLRVGN